ncbi:IMPACT family protein [Flavobacterium sp. JP2137]|uniref:IMPACT family protein n=1 Tax=Flavobacterium sp. JP2137 TaxID=3414510 RepID=UPI003D2FC477
MPLEKDTYQTLAQPSEEILFKEKNSKFFGYAFPITDEDDVKRHLEDLKKMHHAARHWCYAFQLGTDQRYFRANDDGEPNNSAGMPIYGQIQSFELTNVLIVVVRYFGGVKLGVGGLITAYKTAAQLALEESEISERTIDTAFRIQFEYKDMNKVMRVIKEKNLNILSQTMAMSCEIALSIRKSEFQSVLTAFEPLYEVRILTDDEAQ